MRSIRIALLALLFATAGCKTLRGVGRVCLEGAVVVGKVAVHAGHCCCR